MKGLLLVLIFAIGVFAITATPSLCAQPATAGAEGTWEGTLNAGGAQLRVLLSISKSSDGVYLATLTSVDQNNSRIPIDRIEVNGDTVLLGMKAIGAAYEGVVNADHSQIKGTLTQGPGMLPLDFTRSPK